MLIYVVRLPNTMLKIAISGKMGSGKTTLLNAIKDFHNKNHFILTGEDSNLVTRLSLADPVKEVASRYFGMPPNTKDRKLLQQIGQKFREIDPDVWVKLLNQRARDPERYAGQSDKWSAVICDDVRFPNEAKALKDAGWIMIRLDVSEKEQQRRLEKAYGESWKEHWKNRNEVSETSLDDDTESWDYVFTDLHLDKINDAVEEIYEPFQLN